MKFVINKDTLTIEENKFYNSGSVDYYEADVQFDETWNDLTIKAIITKMGENKGISRSPINNKLMLDIQEFGTYTIGFVGYKIENEEKIYQISTDLGVIQYNQGAGEIETENEPIPTATEWEVYIAQIQDMIDNIEDIDITAEKIGKQTTITITKKDGTIQEVVINDGQDGKDGDDYVITQQDYEEIANIVKEDIDIPTTLAELSEDSTHRTVTDTEKGTWNNKAEISDIPDVSNFITKNVNNLTNYTLKTNTGSLIDLEINDTTYVVTLKLKNQDGTVISTDTIDLPLESVVVSGRYDNTTKKVILTLENGSEVDFSVADLVTGLQTEITSQNKLASDLVDDTNSGNKFVTTSEKQIWNNKYDKPNSGIPKTDFASDVQTSLGKADTAIQEHQDISGKEDKTNKVTSIDNTSTDTQYPSAKCVYDSQATQDDEIEALQTENARLKATLPTTTGEGQDITLDKTAEMEFVKPPLPMGNSEQESTTGKNLLNTSNANTTTINGVTSYRSNGVYYLSGTNTKTDATWVLPNVQNTNLPTFEIGQTYTMSFKGTMPNGIYAQLNGVKTSTGTQYSIGSVMRTVPSLTFTIDSDYSRTAQLFIGIQATVTNADCNFAIQIEKGSSATFYESFSGGIPSPNPSYPSEVEVVTGNVEVTISNENNTESKTLPVSLGNIELCKIGDYQDYIYKNEGNWYVHKNTIKTDLSTITSYIHTPGWRNLTAFVADNVFNHGYSGYTTVASLFCNRLIADTPARITGSVINAIGLGRNTSIYVSVEGITTSNALITYFSQNPTYLYAPLATPTDTEITDTTLISQLEEISKTLSYQGQTNISSNQNALFSVEAYQSTKLVLQNINSRLTLVEG